MNLQEKFSIVLILIGLFFVALFFANCGGEDDAVIQSVSFDREKDIGNKPVFGDDYSDIDELDTYSDVQIEDNQEQDIVTDDLDVERGDADEADTEEEIDEIEESDAFEEDIGADELAFYPDASEEDIQEEDIEDNDILEEDIVEEDIVEEDTALPDVVEEDIIEEDTEPACENETDLEFCLRNNFCGEVNGFDNCEKARSVNCGSCKANQICSAENKCEDNNYPENCITGVVGEYLAYPDGNEPEEYFGHIAEGKQIVFDNNFAYFSTGLEIQLLDITDVTDIRYIKTYRKFSEYTDGEHPDAILSLTAIDEYLAVSYNIARKNFIYYRRDDFQDLEIIYNSDIEVEEFTRGSKIVPYRKGASSGFFAGSPSYSEFYYFDTSVPRTCVKSDSKYSFFGLKGPFRNYEGTGEYMVVPQETGAYYFYIKDANYQGGIKAKRIASDNTPVIDLCIKDDIVYTAELQWGMGIISNGQMWGLDEYIGRYDDNFTVNKVIVEDNVAYLLGDKDIRAVDVSDPSNIRHIGTYATPPVSDFKVYNGKLFLTYKDNISIIVVDVSSCKQ